MTERTRRHAAPTVHAGDEAQVGDAEPAATEDHEQLGETTVPQPDVDATDVDDVEEEAAGDPRSRDELLEQLRAAETQRDEYLEALQRAQAEFQNFRKRTMREGSAERDRGAADVISRLLEVLDDLDLALAAGESATDVKGLRKGVELVYGKFLDVLRSLGVERIDAEQVPFDPERHEAVQHESADGDAEPTVVEVLRPGYAINGRVLRAAMVRVRD